MNVVMLCVLGGSKASLTPGFFAITGLRASGFLLTSLTGLAAPTPSPSAIPACFGPSELTSSSLDLGPAGVKGFLRQGSLGIVLVPLVLQDQSPGSGWTLVWAAEQKKETAWEEAGVGDVPRSSQEMLTPESEIHQSDGFLWPEAVAEIFFLPPYQPDLLLPRLRKAMEA